MPLPPRLCCSVCGESDARALVVVRLDGDAGTTLCGSHALIHARTGDPARTVGELRTQLSERRRRRERREVGDELGEALTSAFNGDRRGPGRRRSDVR
jgi:hypothetical protein